MDRVWETRRVYRRFSWELCTGPPGLRTLVLEPNIKLFLFLSRERPDGPAAAMHTFSGRWVPVEAFSLQPALQAHVKGHPRNGHSGLKSTSRLPWAPGPGNYASLTGHRKRVWKDRCPETGGASGLDSGGRNGGTGGRDTERPLG